MLSDQNLKAGTYTVKVVNAGKVAHALAITGPGVTSDATSSLQPGQSATLTAKLQSGSYDFFCPIPGHKQLGMNLNVSVGA